MRSVFVHLKEATEDNAALWLSSFTYAQGLKAPWLYPDSKNATLYINFYRDYQEFEPEDYERLIATLGCAPSLSIIADVSGRVDGTTEVKYFVTAALRQFNGVGEDEYSTHFWTLEEIEDNILVEGLHFFDFKGAYKLHSEE